ncbi:MFS transporter [uncultured Piscinibacter sp.]|mgnify:CR=1 FL=1|uniref:MFS transporter n=1 Tax=uncultured Piscinibacter sp. TaxID=1131835 RepID=UPI002608065C|nr:MFS transporter [uncultured Piscinibacter sp.]
MSPPGFRATVAALAAGQLLCWAALYYGFSSFVLPMQRALGWSKPEVMGAFTVGLGVWGATTYAVGAAIDHGRGRMVMTLGAALAGLGFLAWSRATSLPWLHGAWVLLGAAMAMTLYEPAFNVLTRRFPAQYREGITALTLVGGFASTLSFPAVAALVAWLDWRGALAAIGVVLLAVGAPLHAWALRGTPTHDSPGRPHDAADDATLHEALRERTSWLLTATFTLYAFAAAALWAHIMPAFAAKGLSEASALAVVVWFGPAQVAGRLAFLAFGRWVSTRLLGLVVLGGLPLSLAIFALADGRLALLLFATLFGLANGLVTIVRGNLVPQYFGREHVGRISGAMSAIALLSRAAAPLATAWLLLALPGYRELLLGLAAVGAVAVGAFALARPPRR